MKIKSVTFWQPAGPIRAVLVSIGDGGKVVSEDMVVLGMMTELREGKEYDECYHSVIVWHPLHGRPCSSDDFTGEFYRAIFAPASSPPEFWERMIKANGEILAKEWSRLEGS